MGELHKLTIKQAHEGLKEKKFSSVELTQASLDRIEQTNSELNSFITITKDKALEMAADIDKKGQFDEPLAGVPVAVKDLLCTQNVRTTAASKILENYIPPYSSTAYELIEKSGAVLVGKTNLDEFACGGSGETSYFGPTKNPWNTDCVPGGSSSGSAAAVAAQQAQYAIGTDTGGSIRQPASLCGVVGLKPTYGSVSRFGVTAMASSLDQVGPITKTVEDSALVFNALVARDPKDATTVERAKEDFTSSLGNAINGIRIGIPKEFFAEGIDDSVKAVVLKAVEKLKELGAEIVDVSLPMTKYGLAVYYILMPSELSANLARYDGVRFGFSAGQETLMENYKQTRQQGFGDEIRRRIMIGTYALSSGYYDAYYKQAQKVRTLVRQDFERVFEDVDCILGATSPTVAFKIGEKTSDPLAMYLADIFTVPVNIAGLPGLSVPCGFADELPVGMQLIGKRFDEKTILQVGHQYEQATEWHTRFPEL